MVAAHRRSNEENPIWKGFDSGRAFLLYRFCTILRIYKVLKDFHEMLLIIIVLIACEVSMLHVLCLGVMTMYVKEIINCLVR